MEIDSQIRNLHRPCGEGGVSKYIPRVRCSDEKEMLDDVNMSQRHADRDKEHGKAGTESESEKSVCGHA